MRWHRKGDGGSRGQMGGEGWGRSDWIGSEIEKKGRWPQSFPRFSPSHKPGRRFREKPRRERWRGRQAPHTPCMPRLSCSRASTPARTPPSPRLPRQARSPTLHPYVSPHIFFALRADILFSYLFGRPASLGGPTRGAARAPACGKKGSLRQWHDGKAGCRARGRLERSRARTPPRRKGISGEPFFNFATIFSRRDKLTPSRAAARALCRSSFHARALQRQMGWVRWAVPKRFTRVPGIANHSKTVRVVDCDKQAFFFELYFFF